MGDTVLYMSMSLDGFIAGPNEADDNGLGDGWRETPRMGVPSPGRRGTTRSSTSSCPPARSSPAEERSSPPEAGRATTTTVYPSGVISRRLAPDWTRGMASVHYTNDVEAAFREARSAAGGKDVLVHGASTAQRAISAGLLDQLEIHLIPVLLGSGRRLFQHLGSEQRGLERLRILAGDGGVTHLRYRIRY